MTSYRTTMRQALEEMQQNLNESNIDLMRKAAGGAAQTVKMKDGKLKMDMFTASAIMQILDKVNPANKKKMTDMINDGKKADIMKLQKFAMSKVNASYEEFEEEFALFELDEAKYELYHKDFSSAMQHAYHVAKKHHGITVDPKEIDDKVASGPSKPSEGKTNTYRLKGDKGAIQVQVYNKGGSKPFELNMYKEEVDLDEGTKQVLAHGGKGQYKAVRDGSITKVMYKGKVVGTADFDSGADSFFASIKGEKGQKSFDDAQAMVDYFAKNKIKEEDELDEGTWALPKTPKEKAALKKLLSKPLKAKDASDKLYDIIGDDELADDVDDFADNNPNDDVRPIVKGHMKRLGIKEDTELDEGYMELEFKDKTTAERAYNYINNKIWAGGNPPYDDFNQEGNSLQIDTDGNLNRRNQMLKDLEDLPRNMKFKVVVNEASARADAMKAMRKGKSVDPADVDDSATDDDVKAASKNIIMQLRKAVSLKSYDVEFADGKKQKVDQKIAQAVQNKYNNMRRPADKEKFQSQIAKSYKDMLQSLKAGYGEQKESILDRIGKKLKERKNG
jgi:hypothetical protein